MEDLCDLCQIIFAGLKLNKVAIVFQLIFYNIKIQGIYALYVSQSWKNENFITTAKEGNLCVLMQDQNDKMQPTLCN